MRRLLFSSVPLVIHLPTAGALLPFCPRRFFGFSLPSRVAWAGALPQFRPSLLFHIRR